MKHLAKVAVLGCLLSACTAGKVTMRSGSVNVVVGHNPPEGSFTQLGPISAKHGGGCGLYGSQGDFEGAMNILRNKADERGAHYVQIISQQGEHMTGICLDRAYTIDGFAYRKTAKTSID